MFDFYAAGGNINGDGTGAAIVVMETFVEVLDRLPAEFFDQVFHSLYVVGAWHGAGVALGVHFSVVGFEGRNGGLLAGDEDQPMKVLEVESCVNLAIPLMAAQVPAGFPSPAEDSEDKPLDFNELPAKKLAQLSWRRCGVIERSWPVSARSYVTAE